jgi:hypothetical protein
MFREKYYLDYHFNTSPNTITSQYMALLTDNIKHIQPQLNKLKQYLDWAYMNMCINKCAVTMPNQIQISNILVQHTLNSKTSTTRDNTMSCHKMNPTPTWE